MRLNAKELIADARITAPTLPPAAAKLMSDMADRLDVQFVALCESREQVKQLAAERDAVVAENVSLKFAINAVYRTAEDCEFNGDELKYVVEPSEFDALTDLLDETPATDAILASLRAEGVDTYADFLAGLGWHEQDIKNVRNFAAQLRSQSEQVKGVQS